MKNLFKDRDRFFIGGICVHLRPAVTTTEWLDRPNPGITDDLNLTIQRP